ncbi:MAG: hypothetical protein NC212_08950 [Staphylococcus sp.]|nr:hypothetical protein [Staphylococcus sp.]
MNEQKQTAMCRLSAQQVISLLAGIGSDLTLSGGDVSLSQTALGICLHVDGGMVEINYIKEGGK